MKRLRILRNSVLIIDLERHFSRSHGLKKCFQTLLMLSALLAATSAAAQAPQPIEWELVNPFRFIYDRETIDQLRDAYAGLPADQRTAAALERKLQDQSESDVTQRREAAQAKYDCKHTKSREERRQCFEPYAGWFAKVAKNNHDLTCWDSKDHRFRNTAACKDYIYPTKHRVRVWITNSETYGDSDPNWTVPPAAEKKSCDAKYGKRFCIEFNVTYPEQSHVVAQFPSVTLERDIKIEDRLIVGLGDSFAAGEGNPDIPAQFIDSDIINERDRLASWLAGRDTTTYPTKDKGTEAAWLDRRCHRSMYSYQFKTALQLALSKPQEAVTYVTCSCSGAVTNEIIKDRQKANERGSRLQPQLTALREVLQNGTKPTRQIDYLLLSTGGNDVGFADYVGYILLRQRSLLNALARLNLSEERMKDNFEKAKFEKDLLGDGAVPGNYMKLQEAMFAPVTAGKPNLISIKGCEAGPPCAQILLTPYPNILTDEEGSHCEGNRVEFDQSFGNDDQRAAKIETVRKYVFEQIMSVQRQVGARLGWTLIDRNVDLYHKHGFCARNSTSTSIGEKFQIPTWVNKAWTNFDPRDYRSYGSRSRWFRLPVDSKMTTDQRSKLPFGLTLDVALEDVRSNIMHPTAEGLAETADANVAAIRKIKAAN